MAGWEEAHLAVTESAVTAVDASRIPNKTWLIIFSTALITRLVYRK